MELSSAPVWTGFLVVATPVASGPLTMGSPGAKAEPFEISTWPFVPAVVPPVPPSVAASGKLSAFCLPLNVDQSALVTRPRALALAFGKLKACVLPALAMLKSVPEVPVERVCELALNPLSDVMPELEPAVIVQSVRESPVLSAQEIPGPVKFKSWRCWSVVPLCSTVV